MSLILCTVFAGGCALLATESPRQPAPTGLIVTPPTYYSTAKARYLGTKYKDNLDRLAERIVRNPKTANLQFANNISSVGGIGFFTHSAAKSPDERYLEVVLGTSETFETKGAQSEKVARLFSLYGVELLGMLHGDADIFLDKELSGYGLNLAWRNVAVESTGNRVLVERAIIYFSKERVRRFLRRELSQNEILGDAVIFAMEADGPLQLVSYRPQEVRPDFRPAIREDNLAVGEIPAKPMPAQALTQPVQRSEEKIDKARIDSSRIKEPAPKPVTKPGAVEAPAKVEVPVVAEEKSVVFTRKPAASPTAPAAKTKPVPSLATEQLTARESNDNIGKTNQPPVESRQEVRRDLTQSSVPAPEAKVKNPAQVETSAREPVASAVAPPKRNALVEKAIETALPAPAAKIPEAAKSAPAPSKAKVDLTIVEPKPESPPPAPKVVVEPVKKQAVVETKPSDSSELPAAPAIAASTANTAEVESPASSPPAAAKAEDKPVAVKPAVVIAPPISRAAPEAQAPVANVPTPAIKIPEPVTPAQLPTSATKPEQTLKRPKAATPAIEAGAAKPVEVESPASSPLAAAKVETEPIATTPTKEMAAPVSRVSPKIQPPVDPVAVPAIKIPEPVAPARLPTNAANVEPIAETSKPAWPAIAASTANTAEVESPASSPPAAAKAEDKPVAVKPAVVIAPPISRAAPEAQAPVATAPTTTSKISEPVAPARLPTSAAKPEPMDVAPKPAEPAKIAVGPKEVQPAVEAKAREAVVLRPVIPADSSNKPKSAEVKPPVTAAILPAKADPDPSVVNPSAEMAAPISKGTTPKAAAPVEVMPAPTAKIPESARIREPATPSPLSNASDVEQSAMRTQPAAPVIAPASQENIGEKTAGEQIALLKNKPIEALPEIKPLVRPMPRALEGFIVQLAFNDKEKARRWAEGMEKRGYAVSITEAGSEGALRVRLGNFAQRDEAERQLRNFKQEGLNGIIINLPQGFQPEARSSIP